MLRNQYQNLSLQIHVEDKFNKELNDSEEKNIDSDDILQLYVEDEFNEEMNESSLNIAEKNEHLQSVQTKSTPVVLDIEESKEKFSAIVGEENKEGSQMLDKEKIKPMPL